MGLLRSGGINRFPERMQSGEQDIESDPNAV